MDLPATDPDARLSDYAETALDAMSNVEDPIVLVGHSLAGLTIPLVAERRPVDAMVFVCAVYPELGESFDIPVAAGGSAHASGAEKMTSEVKAALRFEPDGSHTVDPALARNVFYNTCTPEVAAWAVKELRPQGNVGHEPTSLKAWPDVAAYSVIGSEDHAVRPDWSRRAAREILGVDAIELPTDHSPFLSAPAALAAILVGIAEGRYPAGRGRAWD